MALIHKNNRMTPILTLLTLLCVVCISIGQLLFKKAATALPENPQIIDWVFNGWLFSSLVLYGFTTLGWIWILRHAPLHMAYPFMGLAFLIVPTLAWVIFNEPLHWRTLDRKSTRLNSSHLVSRMPSSA